MAFCNKIGSLMKQTISFNSPSMLNAIRCMSSSKLFIGGSLKDAFSSFGEVSEARVITDRGTGKSRGYGFVNFNDDQSATSALSAMDKQELNGRTIHMSYANGPRTGKFGVVGGGNRGGY